MDLHCEKILEQYRENTELFEKMLSFTVGKLKSILDHNSILVTGVEGRLKKEQSLVGKLELKGAKYATLKDITDIVGCRIITFYSDDVDKIAALVETNFDIDWANSVDKRKMLQLDTFGYQSLHYICSLRPSDVPDPVMCSYRIEIQLRTALQHVWANMYHDTGYKSGVEIPKEHLRNLNRLAGMLELADEQFSRIRTEITDYRRHVSALVASGNFNDVSLNGDTYRNFLELNPFTPLLKRIAAINQAEIYEDGSLPRYLKVFLKLGFKTLGDIERLIKEYSEDAYAMARYEIGVTDLDIISGSVAAQDLCTVYILKNGLGKQNLVDMFYELCGNIPSATTQAERILKESVNFSFMN